ncbi:uncharacterized protein N7459_003427 [Penicillium hispanicum]|uniref:uncharacterized protein n=1 Tax=Penicillium hispanicum TaxID=1080232 RepID=UPI002542389F|nr:uncharacterized protein N7459_003427 [Penicillium hispanicum]KAJ5587662.1 hypothetical protein N7459_003427 [Penicillium hispanicum]
MTVAIGSNPPKTPSPTPAVPLLQKNSNKRWPPMANRNTLPYKLTVISKEKLAREATAPDPSLRRCVAHFRLHCGSVMWTENDMKSRISSFDFEETDEEDESEDKKDQSTTPEAFVKVEITETEVNATPANPQLSADNGLMEDTMDMSSKNICCISVGPVAG